MASYAAAVKGTSETDSVSETQEQGTPKPVSRSGGRKRRDKNNQEKDVANIVVEEKARGHTGGRLTGLRENEKETVQAQDRHRSSRSIDNDSHELVSGRKAGRGWDRSVIRFAPLNMPVKRRLQTTAVLFHTLSIAFSVAAFFFLAAIPLNWFWLFPYVIYINFSDPGSSGDLSRRWELLRSARIWSLFASYFPARLHRSQELPPTRKYVFGYHPHGIISHGAFSAFATEALGFSQLFPGITNSLLTLESNFRLPFYRDYALAMGIRSVSKESIQNLLSKGGKNGEGMGRAVTIVIGGASESLDAKPQSLRLILEKRKGFVKIAITCGADLVPVLCFGENDLYNQLDGESYPVIHKFQMWVKKVMGFTVPIFFARGVFNYDIGLMPFRHPLNIVVGRPIKVVQASEPDKDYINELHTQYVEELQRIWREWKDEFARGADYELQIVE